MVFRSFGGWSFEHSTTYCRRHEIGRILVNQAPLALAFAAGMVASFNPCGFSLLPAYLAMFVSGDRAHERLDRRVVRALAVSAAVSVGFVVVFATAGVVLDQVTSGVKQQLPWITVAVGALLMVGGIAAIGGWKPQLQVALPDRSNSGSGFGSMVGYGATYAVASLTCTLGPFLAVTGAALNQSAVGGVVTYVSYAMGMGTVILALSVTAALARSSVTSRLRVISRHAGRLSGVLMLAAGSYAVWYGRWELAVYRGNLAADPIVEGGEDARVWLISLIDRVGASRIGLAVGLVVIGAVGLGWASRHQSPHISGDERRPEGSVSSQGR